jgi:hypothetical protein
MTQQFNSFLADALLITLTALNKTIGEAIDALQREERLQAIGILAGTFEQEAANVNAALQLLRTHRQGRLT